MGHHRDRVSVIGAVTVSPGAGRCGFDCATDPDGYFTTAKAAAFLRDLLRHLRGKVIVVWDGGPNHKREAVRALLARNPRLRVERLPVYASAPTPVGAVWSWRKCGERANFVPRGVSHLGDLVREHLIALKCAPGLRRLWDGAGLPFPARSVKHPGQPAGQ